MDVLVTEIELDSAISAGVMWRSMVPGLVPIYEEQSARVDSGISIERWMEMIPMERAMVVAMRRIKMAIENQQSEAENRHIKAQSRKGKASG